MTKTDPKSDQNGPQKYPKWIPKVTKMEPTSDQKWTPIVMPKINVQFEVFETASTFCASAVADPQLCCALD